MTIHTLAVARLVLLHRDLIQCPRHNQGIHIDIVIMHLHFSACSTPALDAEFNLGAFGNRLLQILLLQSRTNPVSQECRYLLGCASDEGSRVKKRVKFALDWFEVRIGTNAVDEVILQSQLLDLVAGLMREDLECR